MGVAPEIGFTDLRVPGDVGGRTFEDELSGRQHHDTPGEAKDKVHVVLDHQHGERGGEPRQRFLDTWRIGGGDAGGRLVEQQHLRALGQCDGDLEQALLAIGDHRDLAAGDLGEAERGEDFGGLVGRFRIAVEAGENARRPAVPLQHGHDDMLFRSHIREEARDLEGADEPAPDALLRPERRDVLARQMDMA
jgi:hypothetical protein